MLLAGVLVGASRTAVCKDMTNERLVAAD